MITIDIWGLLIVLLITAILQEFVIKPSVELLRKYYRKSKHHMGTFIFKKKEKIYVEPLMKK